MRPRASISPRISARSRGVGEAGVTLIEVMITSALLMVVLLAVFDSFDTVTKSQAYQADRTANLDDMRTTLNRMTKDLRQATGVSEASFPANALSHTTNTVSFSTYINGVSTPIVYTASGTTLTRTVGTASPFVVLRRLTTTDIFTLIKADAITGVQWVQIDLSVTPASAPSTTLDLDAKVNLRNRTTAYSGTET